MSIHNTHVVYYATVKHDVDMSVLMLTKAVERMEALSARYSKPAAACIDGKFYAVNKGEAALGGMYHRVTLSQITP